MAITLKLSQLEDTPAIGYDVCPTMCPMLLPAD